MNPKSILAASVLLVMPAETRAEAAVSDPEAAVDHAALIRALDAAAEARGEAIYQTMCLACHGTPGKPGSLPDSRAFWKEPFKNGGDPHGIYQTLAKGLGQMPAWPMLTPAQRYDVAHYVREKLVKPANPAAYVKVDEGYLARLPKPRGRFEETAEMREFRKGPRHLRMDFGPTLMWTLEAENDNIAQKGIAIRLDAGPGGVSKGRAWMLYDHDTMRVAAAWSGTDFVNWRGIAFDGSHGTHTAIQGPVGFILPNEPGWADPASATFQDTRIRGLDGKPYGPLPRQHLRYRGLYQHGKRAVLFYQVGTREIWETPGCEVVDGRLVFTRAFEAAPGDSALDCRIALEREAVRLRGGDVQLRRSGGYHLLTVPPSKDRRRFTVEIATSLAAPDGFEPLPAAPDDLGILTRGGPPRWPEVLESAQGEPLTGEGFAVDTIGFPADISNPWQTQWRPGGLDFFADGKRLAVCTWMGDVWTVDGLDQAAGPFRWRRIASGLNQPLGLKIAGDVIHVACRDQIVRLRDLNGDGETDFYECFNNDHQVTEHFHEFAMGLQAGKDGEFYYAKSARHALPALVPQHGTLLKVSADGEQTTILANGLRAANGICVNDDGTFYVTDQEGFWTPKNRINLVKTGGFYGNMWSYGAPADTSDGAMEPPLVWITNSMNRSPGELVRVTPRSWAPLENKLIDMSYGMGRMFLTLLDESDPSQGAVVALPIEDFPTGVMRGRFHPVTGDLYACGMAVWASNKQQDGGLYRVRRTRSPSHLPVSWATSAGEIRITFSDPPDPAAAADPASYELTIWDIKRTAEYGSRHLNEKRLEVRAVRVDPGGRTVTLQVPGLAPTKCLKLLTRLKTADGRSFEREIHATIHHVVNR